MLNFAFLISPLLFLSKLSFGFIQGPDFANLSDLSVYNYCLAWVFIILAPAAMYFAARVLRCSKLVACVAGLLAFAPTIGYFEWLLKYGTLGFCTSVVFLPLALALCYSFAFEEGGANVKRLFAALLLSSLCFAWTLGSLAFLPLVVLALVQFKQVFFGKRLLYLIAFVVLFLCLNLPWLLIFFEESKVFSFLSQSALPGVAEAKSSSDGMSFGSLLEEAKTALKHLRGLLFRGNPLLVIAGSLGCLLYTSPSPRD